MKNRRTIARLETLESRQLCAVDSTAGALVSYGAALASSVADIAQAADTALDDAINAPSPFPVPYSDLYADGPSADPSTRGDGPGGIDGLDSAALDALYRAGGPMPFYALPYEVPQADGYGGYNDIPIPEGMPPFSPELPQ